MTTDFQVPRITAEKADGRRGTFIIEPLDKGFGYTFGNSLRRVLLSSLGGAAITSVRIEGVSHEFSSVPGVKEDVTDIVLNLKDIVVRMHTDADEVEAPLVATGPGEVKAKDIDLPSGVEILNPEAPIATLEKKTKLEVYLTIGRGRGYRPAEDNKSPESPASRSTTTEARSRSSPSIVDSATPLATPCGACCCPRSRARRSPASGSKESRTSSRRSVVSRRTSPTSSST